MSTLKVVSVQHPSSAAANLTLAADGTVTGGLPAGGRNLLYNGAMQVAQRGTSTASITTGGYYTADRWTCSFNTLGTWTESVENDAPTGSGLSKSLKFLCTTADASPAAGDYGYMNQVLEGQDLQRIAKGTASAQQLTLSFWVKSNATGTYIIELTDSDNNRRVSASYSVSASATWEKKALTFPADTTGVFDNDNAGSLNIVWWLAAGSDFTSGTLNTSWTTATTTANRAAGQRNLAAAINNYWQITGVQLEVGPVASAFEFKSYGQELRECQRYYIRYAVTSNNNERFPAMFRGAGSNPNGSVFLPQRMRAKPTAIETSGIRVSDNISFDSATATGATLESGSSNDSLIIVTLTGMSPQPGAGSGWFAYMNGTGSYFGVSAEL